MENQVFTLIVQSFGKENEYNRATLTIFSFFAYNSIGNRVLLFTDNQTWFEPYFKDLPVDYINLPAEKIKHMRGKIDFLHRMKIAEIEEAFEHTKGNLLYADSDTFFTADPSPLMEKLSSRHSFMHIKEYSFDSLRNWALPAGESFVAFVRLIEQNIFKLSDGKMQYNTKMFSWNAGVMMLHWEHRHLLNDVFLLTDQFFPSTQNHASEQYAFSLILQNNTELRPCDEVIYHYWYKVKKAIVDEFLPNQLSKLLKLETSAERMNFAKELTRMLPNYFESHLLTHKDYAIQKFNEHEYWSGLKWAYSAILKGAFKDIVFLKDILYHTRKKIFG